MTWALHIHSPSIIPMLYSMGPSIYMPGECMGRGQSHSGILKRLRIMHRIRNVVISPTCLLHGHTNLDTYLDTYSITSKDMIIIAPETYPCNPQTFPIQPRVYLNTYSSDRSTRTTLKHAIGNAVVVSMSYCVRDSPQSTRNHVRNG